MSDDEPGPEKYAINAPSAEEVREAMEGAVRRISEFHGRPLRGQVNVMAPSGVVRMLAADAIRVGDLVGCDQAGAVFRLVPGLEPLGTVQAVNVDGTIDVGFGSSLAALTDPALVESWAEHAACDDLCREAWRLSAGKPQTEALMRYLYRRPGCRAGILGWTAGNRFIFSD